MSFPQIFSPNFLSSMLLLSRLRTTEQSNIFMTEEDLTLALESARIRARLGLTHFIVGFHIDVTAFLQITKVIVRVRVEGSDVMPCSLGLRTSAIGIRGRRRIIGRGNRVEDVFLFAF